jgi:ssDNA-binding Zn-finger/Zn-ribbon topoisomerase 1
VNCPKGGEHDFQFTGAFYGKKQCVKCKIYEYMAKMYNKINVKDSTTPTEVLKKTKRWFNGMHEFDSIQTKTPAQPTSLGISVGDGSKTGEKIG